MDFYAILGIERRATVAEIKRAYRRLARKFHPDINPGDQAAVVHFHRIVEAYETLADPSRRHEYDVHGAVAREMGEDAPVAFEGFDFSRAAEGMRASTFSELFADVFKAPASTGAGKPEPGADLHGTVALAFEEAVRGCERLLTVTRQVVCQACHGGGEIRTAEGRCLQCQGEGSLRWARGHMVFSKTCTACGGTGRQQRQVCTGCAGQGVTARSEAVAVRIPPGVADGARVRVPEKGHAGRRSGRPGDLYITVQVAPHPLFERDGDDLRLVVPIAVHEAALGARVEVPTVDGRARLRVPPGTQSGQRFRLHGRGVPSPRDGRPGDLIVEVRLVLPRVLDERSKELMREFGRRNDENVRKDLGV
jgi:molecular chaperone DnaJ